MRRPLRLAAAVAAVGATVAAGPAAAAGLTYVGSSTIGENILKDAGPKFTARTGIAVGRIETQGSGRGLEMVLRGQAELAGVARTLSPAERRGLRYHIIGYDAVGVYVHPSNPVRGLTRSQLKGIYTGRIVSWKEVGGPDARIVCITQIWGGLRAQMVEFQAHVMDGLPYRPDRLEVDRQPDQVAALRGQPHGIAALSAAFAAGDLRAVPIEGFPPDPHHVRSGAYLLSRPLILVARPDARPEVRRFLEFMLGAEGQAIVARRFVPVR